MSLNIFHNKNFVLKNYYVKMLALKMLLIISVKICIHGLAVKYLGRYISSVGITENKFIICAT